MKPCVIALLSLLVVTTATDAYGHIAPAKGRNNQYIKVTPMGDRVRLAYTIYIGDEPGRQARRRMDKNRNGVIEDAESEPYGAALAQQVRAGLRPHIDGVAVPIAWSIVHVGLGTPRTDARWFSVDLVAWLCVGDTGRDQHVLELASDFRIDKPGETEIRVEESPGVGIVSAVIEGGAANQLAFKWRGGTTPLATAPYVLTYKVDRAVATIAPDQTCPAGGPGRTTDRRSTTLVVAGLLGALAVIGAAAFALYRKRKRRAPE